MSAMSTLAASISHEVNHLLAAVATNAHACVMWLRNQPPNVPEARRSLIARSRSHRASELIRHIRAMFTKALPERKSPFERTGERGSCSMQVEASRNVSCCEPNCA